MSSLPSPACVALLERMRACTRCEPDGLLLEGAYPILDKHVPADVRVLVVMEAPNHDDTFDADKGYLTYERDTDPTGVFIRELLKSVGLNLEEDVLFTNSVLCLPDGAAGKYPVMALQMELCRPWLGELIDTADPAAVVTFGGKALTAVGKLEAHGLQLAGGVGQLHEWRGRKLLPLYHPSRLGRVNRSEALQREDVQVLGEVV